MSSSHGVSSPLLSTVLLLLYFLWFRFPLVRTKVPPPSPTLPSAPLLTKTPSFFPTLTPFLRATSGSRVFPRDPSFFSYYSPTPTYNSRPSLTFLTVLSVSLITPSTRICMSSLSCGSLVSEKHSTTLYNYLNYV